jgi:hypothetical protein
MNQTLQLSVNCEQQTKKFRNLFLLFAMIQHFKHIEQLFRIKTEQR